MGRELTSKEETAGIREKHTYGGKVSYPSDALGPRLKALLEKIKKLKQNKLSLSIYSDHIVVSKHLFSRKKNKASWRIGCFQVWSRKHIKGAQNILYQKPRKLSNTTGVMSKGHRCQLEGAPTGQKGIICASKSKLNKQKPCSELQHIKYF